MSNIVNKIKRIDNLYYGKGVSDRDILVAEQKLGLTFPAEYKSILKEFGTISFHGTEWTGLNVQGELNVVTATESERDLSRYVPSDCFVLESIGNGEIILCNSSGDVYSLRSSKLTKIYNSINKYLDECIKRS